MNVIGVAGAAAAGSGDSGIAGAGSESGSATAHGATSGGTAAASRRAAPVSRPPAGSTVRMVSNFGMFVDAQDAAAGVLAIRHCYKLPSACYRLHVLLSAPSLPPDRYRSTFTRGGRINEDVPAGLVVQPSARLGHYTHALLGGRAAGQHLDSLGGSDWMGILFSWQSLLAACRTCFLHPSTMYLRRRRFLPSHPFQPFLVVKWLMRWRCFLVLQLASMMSGTAKRMATIRSSNRSRRLFCACR